MLYGWNVRGCVLAVQRVLREAVFCIVVSICCIVVLYCCICCVVVLYCYFAGLFSIVDMYVGDTHYTPSAPTSCARQFLRMNR
jgi:hypothetical protein